MMDPKEITLLSKQLSYLLRHRPEEVGIELDENGWASIDELLQGINSRYGHATREMLEEVVRQSDKQRFAISDDGQRIRASQGHSIKVDLGYEPKEPPMYLYHGTAVQFMDKILSEGLDKRHRHDVHLSESPEIALEVGRRHGKPVVLVVLALAMHQAGLEFRCSANGVWLIDSVPASYLKIWSQE